MSFKTHKDIYLAMIDGVRVNKGRIFQSEFTECSFREYDDGYGKLLLTESKEVEYDDV